MLIQGELMVSYNSVCIGISI